MAQEIERKFLVAGDFKPFAKKATRITQGYLSSVPERTVRVRVKGEFPISRAVLENEVFPAFMVEMPALDKDEYTYDEFIAMVKANPDLAAVRVHKQRFGYMVNDTICEVGNVLINGAKVVTINSESTEIEDIKKTIADCGLEGVENINYLQAIKRVIGMSVKPLANE